MHTNETIELEIDGIAQGGDGVGRYDGLVVFARGGLPGERVRVGLRERKPSYARGDVLTVLRPAPERVAPRTPDEGHAPWQQIAYPAQLRFKETIVREQLAKLADLATAPVAPIIAAPQPWGYRNSARLHGDGASLGYYSARSRDVAPLADDPLLLPALNEALAGLRTLWSLGPARLIRGLTLRASAAGGYAVAQINPFHDADPGDLADLARAWRARVPTLAGVIQEGGALLDGASTLHDQIGAVVFSLSPASFFQVNAPQAERMLGMLREQLNLPAGARLLDAYSGAGTFALPLAAGLAEVVAVEEHPSAVADGERSAVLNGIVNVRFVASSVERALPEIAGPFDAVVLDPPRRGCHPAALAALVELAPPQIAYISCHPGILARDLGPLLAAGYRVELVQPIDLFPQTPHIETLVMLRR